MTWRFISVGKYRVLPEGLRQSFLHSRTSERKKKGPFNPENINQMGRMKFSKIIGYHEEEEAVNFELTKI